MGRIGLAEICIVLLVAFLFIPPKDFLQFIRKLADAYRQMKSLRNDFMKDIRDIQKEFEGDGRK